MNIGEYLPSRRRGKYSPIFTSPEGNNCFSIISELKNRENWIYFHFGDFLVGNLGKSVGSHFVFENKRLRAIFTALRVFSRDIKLMHMTFHRWLGKLLGHELLMSFWSNISQGRVSSDIQILRSGLKKKRCYRKALCCPWSTKSLSITPSKIDLFVRATSGVENVKECWGEYCNRTYRGSVAKSKE